MNELQAIVRALSEAPSAPAVLATLVSVEGSSYRRPGARLLLLGDGRRIGSISGGCLEEDVIARARHVGITRKSETAIYDTTTENDLVWGVGLGCHGVVKVLIEPVPARPRWADALARNFAARRPTHVVVAHDCGVEGEAGTRVEAEAAATTSVLFAQTVPPPLRLCVFGAGEDARPVARLGASLGWSVTVADPRAAFATAERFPSAEHVIVGPAETLATKAAPDDRSVAVVMTHHYIHDVPLLRALLPKELPYLGLLGPRKRAERILADLRASGFEPTASQLARFHAPVGLDLGADGPEQVALAIVAEIQAVLGGRSAQPLKERSMPIHD